MSLLSEHSHIAGVGGVLAVMLMRKFGRLPVLFWSQVSHPVPDNSTKTRWVLAFFSGVPCWRHIFTHSQDIRWYV